MIHLEPMKTPPELDSSRKGGSFPIHLESGVYRGFSRFQRIGWIVGDPVSTQYLPDRSIFAAGIPLAGVLVMNRTEQAIAAYLAGDLIAVRAAFGVNNSDTYGLDCDDSDPASERTLSAFASQDVTVAPRKVA